MLLEYRLGKSYFPPWPIAIACVWTEKAVFFVMLPHRGLHLGSILVLELRTTAVALGVYFGRGPGKEGRVGVLKIQRDGDCLS